MTEKLLSIEEVVQYLDLSEGEVKELVEKGDLPAYKIGGALLRFKREQIEEFRKKRDYAVMVKKRLSQDRGVKNNLAPAEVKRRRIWGDYKNAKGLDNKPTYTSWERIEDFLYYNDFYILSLILLVLIILAVFGI